MPSGAPRNPDNSLEKPNTLLALGRRNFVIYTSAIMHQMAEADVYATKPSLKAVEDFSEPRERQVEVCKF